MESIFIFLGTTVLGLIGYVLMNAFVRAPGVGLQTKFANLTKGTGGVIAGKTYHEIVAACGAPSSVSPTGDGGKLCQWMATGYHIALIFDENNICQGISHEASV